MSPATPLFVTWFITACTVALLSTQEEVIPGGSLATSAVLALWVGAGAALLVVKREYLVGRAIWSIVAAVGPLSAWIYIIIAAHLDITYRRAALFCPVFVVLGFTCLSIYDHHKTTATQANADQFLLPVQEPQQAPERDTRREP